MLYIVVYCCILLYIVVFCCILLYICENEINFSFDSSKKHSLFQENRNLLRINSCETIGHPAVGLVVIYGNLGWPPTNYVPGKDVGLIVIREVLKKEALFS